MTFATLGLADTLLQSLETLGYKTPTPIQEQAIPAILEGRDVMAAAQTGTGKTAGFVLPILHSLATDGIKVGSNSVRARPRADARTGRAGFTPASASTANTAASHLCGLWRISISRR
jgi:hypothetical protein